MVENALPTSWGLSLGIFYWSVTTLTHSRPITLLSGRTHTSSDFSSIPVASLWSLHSFWKVCQLAHWLPLCCIGCRIRGLCSMSLHFWHYVSVVCYYRLFSKSILATKGGGSVKLGWFLKKSKLSTWRLSSACSTDHANVCVICTHHFRFMESWLMVCNVETSRPADQQTSC